MGRGEPQKQKKQHNSKMASNRNGGEVPAGVGGASLVDPGSGQRTAGGETATGRRGGGPGAARVLAKLKEAQAQGQFYEAHQMYRTIYFRYLSQNRHEELQELLYDGALTFLQNGQASSGGDLSVLMVDVLQQGKAIPNEHYFERLSQLFSLMARESPERQTFLGAALKWSSSQTITPQNKPPPPLGHPQLHRLLGLVLWKEKSYPEARFHLLHAADGHSCAKLLVEFHTQKGYPSEVDLFIVRAVLHLLCLQEKGAASSAFKGYTSQHPGIRRVGPPFLLPLLNFIWCLLQAIESRQMTAFAVLLEQYQGALQRDPAYITYLERIGEIFFGLPPANSSGPGAPGILGDILQAFAGGLEDSDTESEESGGGGTAARGSRSGPQSAASLLGSLFGGGGSGRTQRQLQSDELD